MSDPAAPNPGPTPTGYQRSPGGGFRWQPPSAEHLSKLLPQYEVECLLGRGGMGAVYKGRQKSLNRLVAIKILPPEVENEDASYMERFKNEAQVMAKFIHPGIVAVHDFGTVAITAPRDEPPAAAAPDMLYIVMEFVDGTDVAQMITAQGRLPPEHALAIAAHVCDALSYAHSHGVIHRDIKPANILINREGAVKVADFGLAKVDEPGTTGLTKTGMAMGTPDYVAPEALMFGTQVDARADLYAIGVMLYHMLTGEVPRGAFDLPSRRIGTDPRFDAIILKAMKMDREERYQSSSAIRQDLDAILTMPLVQAGGESSAAIPQRSTNFQVREEAPVTRSPAPNHKSKIVNHKSAMITLAATAAVFATGAFLVLKPSSTPSGTTAASRSDEIGVTATALQDASRIPSAPINATASWSAVAERPVPAASATPLSPAPTPANNVKPILIAQANTTP
ncbi:MAG: protein kinase domain-containing protein [Prosthecobacter sp.]|uniref:serine/threonine-protein kinase n=1 Tax=Prosthecobacter sp. TaxID=1965333 RepID=UPI003900A3DD